MRPHMLLGFTNLPVLPHIATFSPGRIESVISRNT
jgi:hypothetical protein